MYRAFVVFAVAVILSACASKPAVVLPKPTIQSIALVPATTPTTYSLENRNGGIGLIIPPIVFLAYSMENRAKAKTLTEKLTASEFALGKAFTDATAAALRRLGYTVHVLDNVPRTAGAPDSIEYEQVSFAADALLHVYFSDVGLYSPPWTVDYIPRVNASGIVFVKGRSDYLYEETIYYGADARDGKKWAIAADEKFAYRDFDVVLNNLSLVRAGFSAGAEEIAKRMSEQIHTAIK